MLTVQELTALGLALPLFADVWMPVMYWLKKYIFSLPFFNLEWSIITAIWCCCLLIMLIERCFPCVSLEDMMLSHNTWHRSKLLRSLGQKYYLFPGIKWLAWTCILSVAYSVPFSATVNTTPISLLWMLGDGDERSCSYLSFGILIPKQAID